MVQTCDLEAYAEQTGNGKTVVFLHAIGLNRRMWKFIRPHFRSDEYHLVTCDLRGHGETSGSGEKWTLELLADDLKGLLDRLNISACSLVGLSLGGMIAQAFVLKYSGIVEKLILCNTTSGQTPESRKALFERAEIVEKAGMAAIAESTVQRWFDAEFIHDSPHTVDFLRSELKRCSPQSFAKATRAIADLDLWERLREIKVPTLVVTGQNDPGTGVDVARRIHEGIAGSKLEIIPRSSHMAACEQPELFAQTIIRFLADERKDGR